MRMCCVIVSHYNISLLILFQVILFQVKQHSICCIYIKWLTTNSRDCDIIMCLEVLESYFQQFC